MSKIRKFSIVFHNTNPQAKPIIEAYFSRQNPKWVIIGEEPYPDQDVPDKHIHIFIEYHNPRSFKKLLKECETLSVRTVYQPQLREGAWGRVQLDQGYGSQQECDDYLAGLTKDKPVDENVTRLEAPPPGHYFCYSCKNHFHGINMTISHPNSTGVCGPCYQKTKDTYPGEWQYFPELMRSIYIFDKSDFPRPGLFSQPIVPPTQNAFF